MLPCKNTEPQTVLVTDPNIRLSCHMLRTHVTVSLRLHYARPFGRSWYWRTESTFTGWRQDMADSTEGKDAFSTPEINIFSQLVILLHGLSF